jgi:hypothetical protein
MKGLDIIMKKYMKRKVEEAEAIEREMIAESNDKNWLNINSKVVMKMENKKEFKKHKFHLQRMFKQLMRK